MSSFKRSRFRYTTPFPEEVFNTPSNVDWVSAGTYSNNEVVRYAHLLYQCLRDHTGLSTNPAEDTANWRRFSSTTSNPANGQIQPFLPAPVVGTKSSHRPAFWPTRA
jgi:hypothetical protein